MTRKSTAGKKKRRKEVVVLRAEPAHPCGRAAAPLRAATTQLASLRRLYRCPRGLRLDLAQFDQPVTTQPTLEFPYGEAG